MIKIVAKSLVSEGKEEHYKAIAEELVRKSAAEEGNIFYTLNVSKNNPRLFAIMECWKDQDAIDFHNATPHFTELVPKLGELCDEKMEVEIYQEI